MKIMANDSMYDDMIYQSEPLGVHVMPCLDKGIDGKRSPALMFTSLPLLLGHVRPCRHSLYHHSRFVISHYIIIILSS